ncbi:DUF2249 domain-containing protein [Pseudactinotalea sp. Z1732]|uniref:DUF2249 domain-containing protein n=1 Tax=Micrococcales TaxID=85006 RepID=UPI003C7C0DAD
MTDVRPMLNVIQEPAGCACGEHDGDLPELDVRPIPHRIRHGSVFGALSAIGSGEAMVLVAPHDPKPLLAQIAEREAGSISVTYLEEGPEAWRLRLQRD